MPGQKLSAWQSQLIDELRVARLATVRPDGSPHLVPVCFALRMDRLFIPVDEKPKTTRNLARLKNIAANPRVSILFDRYDDDWTQLAWVRIDGRATVLSKGGGEPAALGELRRRYPQYVPMDLENLSLIVIEPIAVSAWRWPAG
ncbi:MAG: TIGR03668 family PPOX class F420-dependent oxidoreductase [Dehalococcoidia bacterium]